MIATDDDPRFSVCAFVDRDAASKWQRSAASITAQTYPSWEVVVVTAPDASGAVQSCVSKWPAGRVRLLAAPDAAPPIEALDLAVGAATGDFVVLLQPGDWLAPGAFQQLADVVHDLPWVDYIYTDERVLPEDKIFRKPDWSPERQRAQDYCGRASVFRRSVVNAVGGLRPELAGAAQFDLILRVAEQAREIHHVPADLFHIGSRPMDVDWSKHPTAVSDHLRRVGCAADVEPLPGVAACRIVRPLPRPAPTVSIVIPTVGTARPVWGVERPLVLPAVRSLLGETDYPSMEVIVVADARTPRSIVEAVSNCGVNVVAATGAFNFAERCNAGVAASTGEYVVLLNDDALVEQADWLSVMIGFFAEADVGVVGPRLLYADGTLQHGGLLLNEEPRHIFRGFAGEYPGPFDLLRVDREVSVVTGACLATPRSLWDELGGLSTDFAIAFNDLDYCLRARRLGRRVIWTPHATLYHFESQTRRPEVAQQEVDLLYTRWGEELRKDPYGNPNFEPRQARWVERQPFALDEMLWRLGKAALSRWRRRHDHFQP